MNTETHHQKQHRSRDTNTIDIETHHHQKRRRKIEQITGIPNLFDANKAGGKFSSKCTLILTAGGDSVRAFASAGIHGVAHDYYGVFPLGDELDELVSSVREASKKQIMENVFPLGDKLVSSVREAFEKQIMENVEIQHIVQILGLKYGKVYDSVKSLRYGHLMIMTNQDSDGSLMKGLLINFIYFFWPSLLKIPKFLMEFITPIVKVCTIIEARQCFQNLKTHLRYFTWMDETDGDAIDMAFDVNILERKAWILKFEDETYPDDEVKFIRYRDFVTKDLMLYSLANMQQSIPSMFDGLKQVQRTILCCAFQQDLVVLSWIDQFLDYVSEHSAFQYDAETLSEAIIEMSTDFVGTNNVNLFNPEGVLWPRVKSEAQLFATNFTPIARLLFPKDDDILLNYPNEDGQLFQPTRYAPVIPLILVNGCQDFGIGWSTFVPNYNPKELCANVRRLLNDETMMPMDPWYKGFQGTIERTGASSYTASGKIEYKDDKKLWITVLPLHTSTKCYKEFLDTLCTCTGETEEPFIKNYKEHQDTTVQFEITMSKQNMELAMEEGLVNKFKLTSKISTNYMHLCDPQGVIKKYDSPEQILHEFFHLRLHLYGIRKEMLLAYLRLELFIVECKEKIIFNVRNHNYNLWSREDIFCGLKQKGLLILFQKTKNFDKENSSQATGDVEVNEEQVSSFYRDLLSSSYTTLENIDLEKQKLTLQMKELESYSPKKLWMKDIDTLENFLHEQEPNNKDAITEAEVDRENEVAMADNNISEKLHGLSLQKV